MATANNQNEYTVTGKITDKNGQPIKGALVRATDDQNTSGSLLGKAVHTDDKGEYRIVYYEEHFKITGRENERADITISVFSAKGRLLGVSEKLENSPQKSTIDIIMDIASNELKEIELMVSGHILLQNEQPARQFFIQAFDKDLRSEQLLGEGMTDRNGKYSIIYNSNTVIRAERGTADVFIRIFDPSNNPAGMSDIIFNAPSSAVVNFQIKANEVSPLSEFDLLQRAIIPLLSEVDVLKLDESEIHRDITFLKGETGYSNDQVNNFIQAHHFEKNSNIDVEFWYVVLGISFYESTGYKNLEEQRQQIIERLNQLQEHGIRKAMRIAFASNKIEEVSEEVLQKWIQLFEDYVAGAVVLSEETFIHKALADVGIKDDGRKVAFAKVFNKYKSFSSELKEELKNAQFDNNEIDEFQTSYDLNGIVNGDFELVKSIKDTFKVSVPEEIPNLAKKSEEDWASIVKNTRETGNSRITFNVEVPKDQEQSFTEVYGKTLYNQFSIAFPTIAFSGGLDRAIDKGKVTGLKSPERIKRIIDSNSDFDFLTTSIDEFAKKNSDLSKDETLKSEFKAVQRVFKLSPNFEATDTLMRDKFHSAHGIYRMGESAFIRKYENQPGFNKKKAKSTWLKAEATHAATITLIAELKATENASYIAALSSGNNAVLEFPNWNNLFKGGDICECKHCRSVYSPAAYFADILMFLKDRRTDGINGIPVKSVLFDRRPDLGFLELNCENANVTLPYIDVVNEVLEDVVADGDNDQELAGLVTIDDLDLEQSTEDVIAALQAENLSIGNNVHLSRIGATDRWIIHSDSITYLLKKKGGVNYFAEILRNTKAKGDELRANPQYVNPFAYQKLRAAKYPFALPFDLFGTEVKASFDKVKIKRWELMQKFKGTAAPNNASEGEIAAVYFGFSVDSGVPIDEKSIILDTAPADQFELWGEVSNASLLENIRNVKNFLRVTGLKYTQLLTLIDLEFINPDGTIRIDHLDPTCDTSQKEISALNVNVLDRINRFLRLWRKLDWEMWEVDLVINHDNIGDGNLNEQFLINLMYFLELKNKLGKKASIEQVCSLFGDLNTRTQFTELYEHRDDAIYQNLFLNKKLINPLDEAFVVDAVNANANSEKIASHKSVIQAALRLKESDLDVYLNLTKASDGTLYIPNGVDGDLILSNLSFLYRHSFIAKSLKVKAMDWLTYLKICNDDIDVFTNPKSTCEFVDEILLLKSSEFKIDDLNYILSSDLESKAAFKEAGVSRFLTSLRNSLKETSANFDASQYEFLQEVPPSDSEKLADLLISLLQKLNVSDGSSNYILNVLENIATTEAEVQGLPGGFEFPVGISDVIKIGYNNDTKIIRFTGTMTDAERNTLLTDGSLAAVTGILAYQEIIEELYQQSRLAIKFYQPKFSSQLTNLPEAIDFKNQLSQELSSKISFNASEQILEFNGIMSNMEKIALEMLSPDVEYLDAINSLRSQPVSGLFEASELWLDFVDLDFNAPNYYEEHLTLAINRLLNYLKEKGLESNIIQQLSGQLRLNENMTKELVNNYQLIGLETIYDHFKNTFANTSGVIDYGGFKNSYDSFYWLHKASLLINKWELNFAELQWLMTNHTATQTLDLASLPIDNSNVIASIEQLLRTEKLLKINARFRNEETSILTIIERLSNGDLVNVSDFSQEIELLTEWISSDVEEWVNNVELNFESDYLLAENWIRLSDSMKILEQLNAGTMTVLNYANATMSQLDSLTLKQLLRSKYGSETWLTISTEIQDELRESKRDALAAYILAQPQPSDAPSGKWENTNDLYSYYLLDVEMSSCMLTSRLVQGSGSIQLFVQRCFMGLEPDVKVKSDGDDGDSAWRWWKWMRKYRVWEANRKVFLYPENWIEPELRKDKSSFFQDLENELLQNEVNQINVEQAFLNYLDKLNEVARLEIAAFYHEDDGDQTIVHVFGRTANAEPHIYYYRKYDYRTWTPWKKMEVEIVGNHLIPIVINKRLYIYWPEFREEPDQDSIYGDSSIPEGGEDNYKIQKTYKVTQLRLSGSEYRNEKWTSKKTSKDFFVSGSYPDKLDIESIAFYPVDRSEIDGRLGIKFSGPMSGAFELFGCEGIPIKSTKLKGSFNHIITPEQIELNSLDFVELFNRPDAPEDDFSLKNNSFNFGGLFGPLIKDPITLLHKSPDIFKSHFAWHMSYMDKLYQGIPGMQFGSVDRRLPMGAWLPFFYADKRKTFMAFPMLGCNDNPKPSILSNTGSTTGLLYNCESSMQIVNSILGGDENSKFYYPDIKMGFRGQQKEIEADIRSKFGTADLSAFSNVQKVIAANIINAYLGLEEVFEISDEELIELIIVFYVRIFNFYLGIYSSLLFNFRRYHFKNFYHPFVCEFIKLVYNPTQGIPALMSRKTQLKDSGFKFNKTYYPTNWVYDHNPGNEFPKEIVDFSPDGSYSPYNWELFYQTPLMIANSLSRNQKFEEAMEWYHFIFNPIGVEGSLPDGSNAESPQKYWITKPFFLTTNEEYNNQRIDSIMRMIAGDETTEGFSNQIKSDLEAQVNDWRYNPFEPHRIAQYRNVAYQKTVFMKYLDNLIAWGDHLFRQDSMESINEATQLFILAAELLGPKPQTIPPQKVPPIETFNELEEDFDDFSNALIQIENYIPAMNTSGDIDDTLTSSGSALAPIPSLYFCIPQNDKILGYWDTIMDRLYKIRNCMNIDGVVRQLSLFEPEIDPGALVKAVAGGMDIGSALADLNAPLPYYRFNTLLQKANEVCNDVKSLGSALLSALEKKDAEELSLLRQEHEYKLLEAVKGVKEMQIEEIKLNLDGIKETKKLTEIKWKYYRDIEEINAREQLNIDKLNEAHGYQEAAQGVTLAASIVSLIPDIDLGASGFGGSPLAKFKFGGMNLGQAGKLASDILSFLSTMSSNDATMASIKGGQERRWDEWKHQEEMAEQELVQIDEQIKAIEFRIKIAEKELSNQELQMENSKEMSNFMKAKYTNKNLYQWMIGQISQVYFKSYQLAYDLAKRAERCYRFELGIQDSNFIKFGYWDSLKKGLLSGDKLQYDLRRLETSYLDENRRELELTKHISLASLDPIALIKLRETGKCFLNLPEEIFDLDYPGHYFRRIKSVSISLPCITGPYTTIACSLRLLNNHIRNKTGLADGYAHNNEDGIWVNDSRFVQNNIPIKSIATSSAQNDSGIFELNFRDERYLPFEGAGVISDWTIDLFNDPNADDFGKSLRQFDYTTISDAIIHIKYTAREAGGLLKEGAIVNLGEYYGSDDGSPSMKIINLKHDFSSEWHKMLNPNNPVDGNVLEFKMRSHLFPYRDNLHSLKVNSITLVGRCSNSGDYNVKFNPPLPTPPPVGSDEMILTEAISYGNLHHATKDTSGDSIELDFSVENIWNLEIESPSENNLEQDEIEDLYLILGYEWE